MKTLFIIFLAYASLFSQNWIWQNPYPLGKNLNSVIALSSELAFSAGENGTVLKTIDGGASWMQIKTGSLYQVNSIYASDENSFIVVGDGGTIFRTTNSGALFSQIISNTSVPLNSITFAGNSGFIAGANGTLLVSQDNGTTWTKKDINTTKSLSKVYFTDALTGYLIGADGLLLKTTNTGASWTIIPTGVSEILSDICASGGNVFICGQNGTILKSVDEGSTWTKIDVSRTNWFSALYFKDSLNGIVTGTPGIILRTSNGGTSWEENEDPKLFQLNGLSFVNSNTGWMVGEKGLTIKTSDFGVSWAFQSSGKTFHLNDIKFIDENKGWVVGDSGTVLRTTNGGSTWFEQILPTKNRLTSIDFYPKNNTAYIVGEDGLMYKSSDIGETWFKEESFTNNSFFDVNDVSISPYMFRVVGNSGTSFVSFDFGKTWRRDQGGLGGNLNSCYMMWEGRIGYFVGDNGIITYFYRKESFTIFEDYSIDPIYDLQDVFFHNIKVGWIVGKSGVVLRAGFTTNFKITHFLDAYKLNSVKFVDSLNGYIAGSNGSVFKSTDSGINWLKLNSGITNTFNQCYFVNKNTGWLIGSDGTILKTENGGGSSGSVTGVHPVPVVKDFVLNQNYPNPFNPSTTISYNLPRTGVVQMKVYDVLGKEVAALLNESQEEGSHKIIFNASGFSSGIYFCRVSFENSISSIKLMLLK